jgi:sugar O-acyltransferase (sialic acid O-acetyltransferase NeuD family)
MKRLIIIGAGGFGREVHQWATECDHHGNTWRIAGFVDDNPAALDDRPGLPPILGRVWHYAPQADDIFVCALGKPALRAQVWDHYTARGATFGSVIHWTAQVGPRVTLGRGVVLCPHVVLTCDCAIGDNTALNVATAVGHDARIGAHCQLSSMCDITGHVTVGDQVFMGSRASILPSKQVGDGAVVGAGAVVIRDVPAHTTVFGNPAKVLFRNDDASL